jgi:ribosomal protein L11 methyltransferase
MSNIYIGYHFKVEPKRSKVHINRWTRETVESFTETETGISAFVQKDLWDETILRTSKYHNLKNLNRIYIRRNWSGKLEWRMGKNFEAIDVEGHVRAPSPKTGCWIWYSNWTKMSFGTGHHETTHMMIQHLLETELQEWKH